ncbi:MAG: SDR family oxidoreductase [Acidobacteriaceae bacterium]
MGDRLKGKSAIVTGASAGIGRATAIALAEEGADLVVTARRDELLQELAAAIRSMGSRAVVCAGDARDESTARTAVQTALSSFGRIDMLINNAGQGNYKNLVDTSAEEYDELMDANMRSSFLFTRHAVPHMVEQKSGVVLMISSVAGLQGYAGEAVYCATKFAQVGFAQALDAELRKHGIKVGVICPGGVKTEFAIGRGRTEKEVAASPMLDPEDVAAAIVGACTQPPKARILELTIRHMG